MYLFVRLPCIGEGGRGRPLSERVHSLHHADMQFLLGELNTFAELDQSTTTLGGGQRSAMDVSFASSGSRLNTPASTMNRRPRSRLSDFFRDIFSSSSRDENGPIKGPRYTAVARLARRDSLSSHEGSPFHPLLSLFTISLIFLYRFVCSFSAASYFVLLRYRCRFATFWPRLHAFFSQ